MAPRLNLCITENFEMTRYLYLNISDTYVRLFDSTKSPDKPILYLWQWRFYRRVPNTHSVINFKKLNPSLP